MLMNLAAFAIAAAAAAAPEAPLTALPYEPSLNVASMDKKIDPCVDFYQYVCGGWQKNNPLPADEASWSVYGKLEHENLQFLWGVLEAASKTKAARTPVDQKIGDYFAACMDVPAIEARGVHPLDQQLKNIDGLKKIADLPDLLGRLQRATASDGFAFSFGSDQDWENSERVIGEIGAGGLGLPD
ncbi:MAG TPA: M13 family metallopeptidase N-terminal domain-containing protein, partial [Myxococcota bacterium]